MSSSHLAPPASSSSGFAQHNHASSSSSSSSKHTSSHSSSHSHHHHHHSNAAIPTASLVEPPALFASVASQIYRSATPIPSNHTFLRTLQLKTILSLTAELPSPSLTAFCKNNGIKFLHFGLKRWGSEDFSSYSPSLPPTTSNKSEDEGEEDTGSLDLSFLHTFKSPSAPLHTSSPTAAPFSTSSSSPTLTEGLVKDSLQILLNSSYHPVLVTDTSGIHEIGVLLGCLRKLQRWNLATILLEYLHFAGNRARATNERFIEMFDTDLITYPEEEKLPFWFKEQVQADDAELDRIESCQ